MALLSKDAILTADDIKHEDVHVPEWGGTVRVVGLSGTERDSFEAAMVDARQTGKGRPSATLRLANIRAKMLVKVLVNEDGQRLFGDGDVAALGRKSGAVLDRLWDVARRLSGMDDDAVEQGKEPSESDPSDSSTSD